MIFISIHTFVLVSEHRKKFTNDLIHESSPYLLQHAHNPVNWNAWNEKVLAKAVLENKPLLVSIGYSACHWCHVMERESFENEDVAAWMNEHFLCIKVDREERPDVDHVYMNALQLITGQGGWPLNMFAMPDGSPFHGGTYFRPDDFKRLLEVVHHEFTQNRDKLEAFAVELKKGMQSQLKSLQIQPTSDFSLVTLQKGVEAWQTDFDTTWGGNTRVPKFPMPVCWKYLNAYAHNADLTALKEHFHRTLVRIGRGGIYDQIGGGFARYSTDRFWKVPHFEKMLYDNGQLLELYAIGLKTTRKLEYKRLIDDTVGWIDREMTVEGGFWISALDADSEGEEGRFYVWKEDELKEILGDDYLFISSYYNVNKLGYWEDGNYILMRDASDEVMAEEWGISREELARKIKMVNEKLLKIRNQRIRPGADDKCLASWNALTIMGLLESHQATGEATYFEMALRNLELMDRYQVTENGMIYRSRKDGISSIPGFLDDYAFMALAMEKMYECTFNEEWLRKSTQIAETIVDQFYDATEGIFYYTSKVAADLIVRPVETYDNVIPSASSTVCELLFRLGHRLHRNSWIELSQNLTLKMVPLIERATESFSNWARLYLTMTIGITEVSVVGEGASDVMKAIQRHYVPFCLFSGSKNDSNIPVLKGKFQEGKTLIYVCKNHHCLAPVKTVEEALMLI